MTDATAAFYEVPCFDRRVFFLADTRRIARAIRAVVNAAVTGVAAVAAVGLLIVTVTVAAAWIVNAALSNPQLHASAPTGPRILALALDAPTLAAAPAESFADKWAQATASMPASAVPIATPQTQLAKLAPAPAPVIVLPLPPRRPTVMANIVPLPLPYPMQRAIALAPVEKAAPPAAPQIAVATPAPAQKRVAPVQEAHNRPLALPGRGSRTALYDIAAHTVYLPDGERLEAHSGLGGKMDDPRYVNVRMHGPTPPNVYDLTLREEIFHGVRAIRLNPVDDDKMFGRAGILAHTYMLGPSGQSFGCVSFKDYQKFLQAYLRGEIDRMVVVAHLDSTAPRIASERRGKAERYASNN